MADGRLPVEAWWPAGEAGVRASRVALGTGISLRVAEAGPRDGPPVLLLHGWGVHAYLWRPNVGALAAAGYRVVAPDLPGHGASDIPLDPAHYTVAGMVGHLEALCDALALGPAAVVGQSMGGMLAVQLALRAPARVTRLALFGPVGFGRIPPHAALSRLVPDLPGGLVARLAPRWMTALVLARVWGRPQAWTAQDVDEYWALTQRPELPRALLRLMRAFAWALHAPATLRALTIPVLVVFGTRDRVVRPGRDAARLVAALPAGTLRWVPEAGHVVNAERPAWVNAALVRFLDGGEVPDYVAAAMNSDTGRG